MQIYYTNKFPDYTSHLCFHKTKSRKKYPLSFSDIEPVIANSHFSKNQRLKQNNALGKIPRSLQAHFLFFLGVVGIIMQTEYGWGGGSPNTQLLKGKYPRFPNFAIHWSSPLPYNSSSITVAEDSLFFVMCYYFLLLLSLLQELTCPSYHNSYFFWFFFLYHSKESYFHWLLPSP